MHCRVSWLRLSVFQALAAPMCTASSAATSGVRRRLRRSASTAWPTAMACMPTGTPATGTPPLTARTARCAAFFSATHVAPLPVNSWLASPSPRAACCLGPAFVRELRQSWTRRVCPCRESPLPPSAQCHPWHIQRACCRGHRVRTQIKRAGRAWSAQVFLPLVGRTVKGVQRLAQVIRDSGVPLADLEAPLKMCAAPAWRPPHGCPSAARVALARRAAQPAAPCSAY